MNKQINRDAFRRIIPKIWKAANVVEIEVISANTFATFFQNQVDRKQIQSGDPWSFDRFLIVLSKPNKQGLISNMNFDRIELWVQIYNIPLLYGLIEIISGTSSTCPLGVLGPNLVDHGGTSEIALGSKLDPSTGEASSLPGIHFKIPICTSDDPSISSAGNHLEEGQVLYFFTHLKKLSVNGSRFCRRIGSGTWAGKDSGKKIRAGNVVGLKKRFRYEDQDSQHDGDWIMHEFAIDSTFLRQHQKPDNIVLCRMKKNLFGQKKRCAEKKRKLKQLNPCNSDRCLPSKRSREIFTMPGTEQSAAVIPVDVQQSEAKFVDTKLIFDPQEIFMPGTTIIPDLTDSSTSKSGEIENMVDQFWQEIFMLGTEESAAIFPLLTDSSTSESEETENPVGAQENTTTTQAEGDNNLVDEGETTGDGSWLDMFNAIPLPSDFPSYDVADF
ncbi:hypothetical protein JRO89_XS05G0207800 [Xanthoceras sorbifolium]|uniref:NAC domain-containing protein n=1 Tax=Xanthoceras sorbifolium TaxID=99658 RepID=A0ABQ8I370_9ROSI|nr:hypothetical protein JRO89_XS05G0207800 [Xanthoceras sorbifolium]